MKDLPIKAAVRTTNEATQVASELVIQPGRHIQPCDQDALVHGTNRSVKLSPGPNGTTAVTTPRLGLALSVPKGASTLHTANECYAMSDRVANGWFGLFRTATDASKGQRLGLKQMYFHDDDGPDMLPVDAEVPMRSQRREAILRELSVQNAAATLKPIAVIEDAAERAIFVVMPLMQGDASDLVPTHTEREPVSWSLFAQASADLADCHGRGYAHRDLKLGNMLWDERGAVVIADYGLALPLDAGQTLVELPFALMVLPPEALALQPYGHKLDCWMLGVANLELLAPGADYFRLGWVENPAHSPEERQTAALAFAKERTKDLAAWRACWLRGADDPQSFWSKPMARAEAANPALFKFVVERLLDPNPTTRASADEASDFGRVHLHALPEKQKLVAREAYARMGKRDNQKRELMFGALRDFLSQSLNRT